MGFYGPITTQDLKASATFFFTGLGHTVGVLAIRSSGEVKNFTTGIQLVRDEKFVGGQKYNLMGWTGPLGPGDSPFQHEQAFDLGGEPPDQIVIASGNEHITVRVEKMPAKETTTSTTLPAPLMGVGSSLNLDFVQAYKEALADLLQKWKPELLESREVSLYRQVVSYMGLVLGAPTFKLTVTLIASDKTAG